MTPEKRRRAWPVVCVLLACSAVVHAHAPNIGLTRRYLNFVAAPGGPNPPVQVVTLSNTTHGRMAWSAAVATRGPAGAGGNWLAVSPRSGLLPGDVEFESVNLTVSVASAALAAGVYYGTITISAPGDAFNGPADNTPQVIEVALTVTTSGQPAPGIALTPRSLAFEGIRGSGRTYTLTAQVANAGGGSLNWTAAPATDQGGAWLSVTPVAGAGAATVAIAAAAGALTAGSYNGRVTFTAPGAANSPQSILVSFQIREPLPPVLQLNTTALSFTGMAETSSPPPQSVSISNGGDGALNWRVLVTTFNGGPWLTAAPAAGSGFGVVNVSADIGNLPPGVYTGRLSITAEGATNSPLQIPVNLTVRRPQPTFERSGVVHAATFQPTPLAPGQIASIFGVRLGPREAVAFTLDPDTGKVPETLAGTTITFDGVRAPLFFVSDGQVNLQVPFEVGGKSSARMVVNVEGLDPAETMVAVAEAAPGVFTVDGTRAAALNQDFTLNTPENPAPVGSVIQLFLTGQGLLNTRVATGVLAPASPPFPTPVLPVTVTIDAIEARVLFAGLAPGFAGLTQVNAEIPRGVSPSAQTRVVVGAGFHIATKTVTIAVR